MPDDATKGSFLKKHAFLLFTKLTNEDQDTSYSSRLFIFSPHKWKLSVFVCHFVIYLSFILKMHSLNPKQPHINSQTSGSLVHHSRDWLMGDYIAVIVCNHRHDPEQLLIGCNRHPGPGQHSVQRLDSRWQTLLSPWLMHSSAEEWIWQPFLKSLVVMELS